MEIDGVAYGIDRRGRGAPLAVLHGFTGNAAAMRDLTDLLAERFDVVAIDVPGHGATGALDDAARYAGPRVARDLVVLLRTLGIERAAWFGYSMGGHYALHVPLAAPGAVAALATLGASPGIAGDDERAARRATDDALAASLERSGLDAFLDRWEALPLFAGVQRLPPERRARLRAARAANDARGLARSLRNFGTGTMTPLHPRLGAIAVPVLALAGADDVRYAAIAAQLADAIPGGRSATIAGAGHAAHLERPADTAALLGEFFSDPDNQRRR